MASSCAPPRPKDWCRAPLPLLTVRVRDGVRLIKVAMGGPKGRRWVHWARWWWERNRGPVPAGKRVCHLDGDLMNDDPSNLGLLTPGDVAFLCHELDPAMSARNFAKMRAATAAFNRARGALNRARTWLAWSWYGVDHARRLVVNRPRRKRWQVYADAGVASPDAGGGNGRGFESAALGWPGRTVTEACVLDVLAGAVLTSVTLRRHAGEARARLGISPAAVSDSLLRQTLWRLGPWVRRLPRPRGVGKLFAAADAALAARGPVCPFRPVRGSELLAGDYRLFTRLDDYDAEVPNDGEGDEDEGGGGAEEGPGPGVPGEDVRQVEGRRPGRRAVPAVR